MTCSFCKDEAVTCCTVHIGEPPSNPKHLGTQQDLRRVVIVRQCKQHAGRLR